MIAVYPGTFDPFTNGHLDLLQRSLKIFDEVTVAVAHNTTKQTLLSVEQRVSMAKIATIDLTGANIVSFDGLLVNFANKIGAKVILRGLRAVSDFEFEFQMAAMNRNLAHNIETIFLTPAEEYSFLSSSMIKDVVRLGGDASKYLHPEAVKLLQQRINNPLD